MARHRPPAMRPAAAPRTLRGLAMHAVRRIREANAAQVELRERVWLRQEPWREELLHWSFDGGEWRLHGERLPWPDGRGRSVTRSGWCPRAVSSE